jgi:hypothetical protein
MRPIVVLFTRDLRTHDNPALHAACAQADRVVPLFVSDPAVPSSPNRDRFLAQSLADLRDSLRRRGGDLVVRHGDAGGAGAGGGDRGGRRRDLVGRGRQWLRRRPAAPAGRPPRTPNGSSCAGSTG